MADLPNYSKRTISLRYWLQGSKYYLALDALNLASKYHTGLRKDGITPEFDHQITVAHYVRSLLNNLEYPEESITTALLHDIREDYNVSDELIRNKFGTRIANAVDAMTKIFEGVKRDETEVFERIANCPIASIVKGGDRIHNFDSMVGVFSQEKQKAYIREGKEFFFPMIKTARRKHF